MNQAKIQIIHKLTRKAKTLTQKNRPEPLQAKFKRKAESAVREVLEIKVCIFLIVVNILLYSKFSS